MIEPVAQVHRIGNCLGGTPFLLILLQLFLTHRISAITFMPVAFGLAKR
jgi:poly(3-hydroxyalkanoate) synthetase